MSVFHQRFTNKEYIVRNYRILVGKVELGLEEGVGKGII